MHMNLTDPVGAIPLIGPSYAKKLKKLEISTVEDLLLHLPSRYVDFRYTTQIKNLKAGEVATITGQVTSIQNIYTKKGKLMQVATLSDGVGKINILWFNQPYLTRAIPAGTTLNVSGKVSFWERRLVIFSPQYEKVIFDRQTVHTGRLIPIYPETAGVSSKWLRSRINYILKKANAFISEDYLQGATLQYRLMPIDQAINKIHMPSTTEEPQVARIRLAFDELLKIQVENNLKRLSWQKHSQSLPIKADKTKLKAFIKTLPFELTLSQRRSIDEIFTDLEKSYPMNRLLEGDVGSGKTVVAAAAAYLAYLNSYQTVVMAPTQILATQHLQTFKKLLAPFGVKISILTSASKNDDYKKADVVIGTHALIDKSVNFKKVALIVIDEQHRFGVKQRGLLAKKGVKSKKAPNILTMTATPIPRTIALTLYGDLDLSTLDEIPEGRQKVTTWIVPEVKRGKAYGWMGGLINQTGSQAFVVCPLIEESEVESLKEVKSARAEEEKLKKVFPKLKIALLHGRIKHKEKDKILADFKNKKYNILVTTPVVEVGIDIPNAGVMVIETADRYGLAQLHQLRGRVGRGGKKSYCLLFTTSKGKKAEARLNALTKSHSGRELAELDLKIRGVGEIFGTRQHGTSELKIATWQDIDLIKKSRKLALEIVSNPEKFQSILDYYKTKQISSN